MSLNPRVCKKSYKVHIPMMGEACEFWLITVTDEQSITNPDKDHAYLTDDGKLFVFNGDSLVRVNCDICFTQEEREKLEGIEENANNYTLPEADSNKLGGVILGYTQNGKNYPITKDTKGNIYVNVPWEEYQLPKATDNALGGIKTGYKQNGKFYPIKTDTDGNAYVQVPWEDTNTVYEVVSKTSNGLMPMLPSDENASKRFLNGDGEWVVGTDNSINGVTQTGSTFSGETSDCGVQILEVKGKTSQKTTNGYQLFDSSKLATKTQGGATVTNNGDGSFTVSGSGNLNENYQIRITLDTETSKRLVKEGTINLSCTSTNPYLFVSFKNNDGTIGELNVRSNSVSSRELTSEQINSDGFYIVLGFWGSKDQPIETGTIKPMLYQDGDGTWEQYTGGKPAPNPDYPMEIENVEISNITSHGRQLFDASRLPTKSLGGATVTNNNDGSFTISGSGNLTSDFSLSYSLTKEDIKCLFRPGRIYIKDAIRKGIYFEITIKSSLSIIKLRNGDKYSFEKDFLDGSINGQMIFYGFTGSLIPNETCKPMVYQDGDGTWEPFKHASVETSLTLAQDDIYQNGTITRDRKQVVFDGSSDEGWAQNNCDIGYRYSIALTPISIISDATNGQTSFNTSLPLGNIGATFDNKNCYTVATDGRLWVSLNGTETLEEFKQYLQAHPMTLEYTLATPTTEEYKVPTIPSYYPYTEVSTDSKVEPEITFKPLPYTTCLVGEATEEESGYMPKLSGNASQFLNGQGEWSTPSGYTLPTASTSQLGGVKIGSNISISDGAISIDKDNVTEALGYTPPTTNTTYEKVDKSSDGLCPKLPNETTTTKYLRQDGAWAIPPNTTYEVASTSADGLMSSSDKTKLTNLRRIWKGTSSSPPSGWVDGDIYVQYEE